MGGRVGLKGTDGVVEAAIELGAQPTAHLKAAATLDEFRRLFETSEGGVYIEWLTCTGAMGADCLRTVGFADFEVAYEAPEETGQKDTKTAAERFLEFGVDLILFCGGDGTARDLCGVVKDRAPLLGIPAGVKMYSGVFGVTPARTAEILLGFLQGRLKVTQADVLDLDEERYRQGEWAVRLCYSALTPYEPALRQAAKMLITETSDAEVKEEIAGYLLEEIRADPAVLYLLGPGSTVQSIGKGLGLEKALLTVDAVAGGEIVGGDLNERQILDLLCLYPRRKLILSPIGAQGFVLGRGNLQLSPEIVKTIGADNIIVVATPAKLARTPVLRFDTGDAALDAELTESGYVPVVIGYRRRRLAKVQA
jgi:predicted polyphosphate/ATP-dependent NAD kinase